MFMVFSCLTLSIIMYSVCNVLQIYYTCIFLFVFQVKWTNKERVLIFSSRGINHRDRHLMNDLKAMMPHSKSGTVHCIHGIYLVSGFV